jgi:hypothetical protein
MRSSLALEAARSSVSSGAWVSVACLIACQGGDPGTMLSDCIDEISGAPPESSPLPAVIEDGFSIDAPELCTWAASVDAIVFGELKAARLVHAPAVENLAPEDGGEAWQFTEDCPSRISPAIALDLEIQTSLRGELHDVVVARIGYEQRSSMRPRPRCGDDGRVEWVDSGGPGEALESGQLLGLALHYVPEHEVWSLMGEAMFGTDAEGRIVFQERQGVEPAPSGAQGMTLDEFTTAVAGCSETPESIARRERIWRGFGPDGQMPTAYFAAWCIGVDQP